MTKDEENQLKHWVQGKDKDEVITFLLHASNSYNRRILLFFRLFCKVAPVLIMLCHAYGIYDFSQHPREMFVLIPENQPCYIFIYIMVYILPIIIILASRFFWLCWKYRIPFIYFFGVNSIHLSYGSIFTTNDMVMAHYSLYIMIASLYIYAIFDSFLNTNIGRRIF